MSYRSRQIRIGGFGHVEAVTLGGGLPPVIQTMWKDRLSFEDLEGEAAERIVSRIDGLRKMGCGLLRFAVPDLEAAEVLGNLASMVSMPLVADIHFDYKIALRCLDFPIAKIRINPGNIGGADKVAAVLGKAAANSRPIRIGVNAGSLPQDLRRRVDSWRGLPTQPFCGGVGNPSPIPYENTILRGTAGSAEYGDEGSLESAEALVQAAEREIAGADKFGFKDVLVSIKASSVADTIKANRILAKRSDVPLHVGVTEAGPLIAGVVRNTVALTVLLGEGIGDTIRVSLSDTMEKEVIAGREILSTAWDLAGKSDREIPFPQGVRVISCPRCGRSGFDTHGFTERWQSRFYAMDRNITIAIMGCAVNGPGEARHADLGITGAGDKALIFRKGELTRTVDTADADAAFEEELMSLAQGHGTSNE